MPLNNKLLRAVAAIDPTSRGHSLSQKYMLGLTTLVSKIVKEELNNYEAEVRLFQTCPEGKLPEVEDDETIDTWWSHVAETGNFSCLTKMVLAILTSYHGPQVESAFSIIGEVIDDKSARTNIKTYSAIQSVKCILKAEGRDAVDYFRKADYLRDPVHLILVKNMTTSNRRYKEELQIRVATQYPIQNSLTFH